MYNTKEYVHLIKGKMSAHRFHHSMCVAERARELAEQYGADAEKAYLAGVLHDVMKEADNAFQLSQIEKAGMTMTALEKNNPKVYHQMSGAAYVKNELGITDEEILGAIRYHTTGRAEMSLFEMILYLADFTSADRTYTDVDTMRAETEKGLFNGMLYSLRYTIVDIASHNRQLHPDTVHCFNWVVAQLQQQRKG